MGTPLNILVVEDHDPLRAVTVEVLRMQGHAVMEAASAEALDELSPDRRFDVAVLDLNLPGEDGFSLAARLRKTCPGIGIVMVTVRHALDDKLTAYQQGADVYLTKPTDPAELCAVVEALQRRLVRDAAVEDSSTPLCLDVGKARLFSSDTSLSLRMPEARVLQALVLAPQGFLEHWQLLQILAKPVDEQGKAQLEVLVSRLRTKLHQLGAAAPAIRAERGRGYRLCVELQLI